MFDYGKNIESKVQAYVDELRTNSVVSYSHYTLAKLYGEFGQKAVQAELDKHWAAEREARAKAEAEVVAKFYQEFNA